MTKRKEWLLYGAYGYTGRLILEEALKRGHRPVISGRSESKLSELSRQFGVEAIPVGLKDRRALQELLKDFPLVLNAAGPFVNTAEPIVEACLQSGTDYLDITGEVPVFEYLFSLERKAKDCGIRIIPGVGFDVVPTDCLANYLHKKLPDASELELAFAGLSRISRGTLRTMIEGITSGGFTRREGKLVPLKLGKLTKKIKIFGRTFTFVAIPWGDLSTAYRSTGIPDITTYMAYPEMIARSMRFTEPVLRALFKFPLIRKTAQYIVKHTFSGPDEGLREKGRAFVWGMVKNDKGETLEACLETIEVYKFTAKSSILCVEKTMKLKEPGVFTPATAFGFDLVLEIEGTRRTG